PFTLREIRLRGLLGTGRAAEAGRHLNDVAGAPAAPQWHIIERVTTGEVLISIGDADTAVFALTEAIAAAERHRLPHQIQRTVRAAAQSGMHDLATEGTAALQRIRATLSA